MPRKYEPVWEKIKTTGACAVQVHKLIAARVVKAVIKEKNNDLAFKLANGVDPCDLKIKRIALADGKHIRLEFRIKQRYGLQEIKKESELEL